MNEGKLGSRSRLRGAGQSAPATAVEPYAIFDDGVPTRIASPQFLEKLAEMDAKDAEAKELSAGAKPKAGRKKTAKKKSNLSSEEGLAEARKRNLSILYLPVTPGAPQPPKLSFSVPFNPTYETDVLKSGNNSSPGVSAGFGGAFLVTASGLRENDVFALNTASASFRYPSFPSKSVDDFNSQFIYQFFINAYRGDGTLIPSTNPDKVQPGMLTIDTFALSVQNQAAFMPTYQSEIANLLTPQATLGRQNIDLSNGTSCRPLYNPNSLQPAPASFCSYANLSLTAGETLSDMHTLQNANIAAAATIGHRFDRTDWTLELQTAATERYYEDVTRRDLTLQGGPVLTYTPNSYLKFSLPVTYFQNYSTLGKAVWSGVVVQPTLTIAFQPPASVH